MGSLLLQPLPLSLLLGLDLELKLMPSCLNLCFLLPAIRGEVNQSRPA